jgi:ubiquinone/menaquinone biosynthesis C-methylase UbiE
MAAGTRDERRDHIHAMWAGVAHGWAEHADYADARGASVTERMLAEAGVAAGERVLELACGPGGLGIAAAELVGPDGEVVLSDVAAEMIAVAGARAAARGLSNVTTLQLDLEEIDQADASYDVVLCREGLMFALDPATACAEIARVLRPGGRLSVAVWGPRERNPWLGLVFDAISAEVGIPLPPPGLPGPFALSDAAQLRGLLAGAGFADVSVGELEAPARAGSFDEWWTRTTALAGPMAKMLATLPTEAREGIVARLRESVAPYATASGGVDIPGVTLLASARRPLR